VLSMHLVPTKNFVSNLVNIQLAYINNRHPEFSDAVLLSSSDRRSVSDASTANPDHNSQAPRGNSEIDMNRQNGQAALKPQMQVQKLKKKPTISQTDNSSLDGVDSNAVSKGTSSNAGLFGLFARSTKKENQGAMGGNDIPAITQASNSAPTEEVIATQRKKLTPNEKYDCQIIERLIRSYYTIVRKTVQDQVPKAIMHFLVNNVRDSLQNELVHHLYNSPNVEDLLNESGSVAERREATSKMLEALRKASTVINEVRETYIW